MWPPPPICESVCWPRRPTGVPAIVVDLTGVSFIDSTALGVLVGAYRRQEDAGGSFKLVVTEPRVLKVLEITDLTSVFPVFASVDEAVRG